MPSDAPRPGWRHYLLPRPSSFVPAPEQVMAFLAQALAAGYLDGAAPFGLLLPGREDFPAWHAGPAAVVAAAAGAPEHSIIHTPFAAAGPCLGAPDLLPAYRLDIRDNYAVLWSDSIVPPERVRCPGCGLRLHDRPAPGWRNELHVRRRCPACGEPVDLSAVVVDWRHPHTGRPTPVQGGYAYRFAIVLACGTDLPGFPAEGANWVAPGFLALCQSAFDRPFYQVGCAA